MSYIGKTYIADDNSYCKNLSKDSNFNGPLDYRLAGTFFEDPKEAIIVSEPYQVNILNVYNNEYNKYWFINVEYNNDTIMVLFKEKKCRCYTRVTYTAI